MPVRVRRCTASDLVVLRDRWPTPGDVARSHFAEQEQGEADFLVAWSGDDPVGWAVLRHAVTAHAAAAVAFPDAAELLHLQVREDHRNAGVGRELIAAAERRTAELGRTQLTIGVDDANPDARRLYHRLGYSSTGVRDTYTYDWVDPDGETQRSTETAETLVKVVSA